MRCFSLLLTLMALWPTWVFSAAKLSPEVAQAINALTERIEALEKRNTELETALASDRLSQDEPPMATRIKAVEGDVDRLKPAGKLAETLDGIAVSGGIALLAQQVSHPAADASKNALSWRGDVEIEAPGGSIGTAEGQFLFHFRAGQGGGVSPASGIPVNASGFDLGGAASNAHAIIAQAYYQLDVPLDDRLLDKSREWLELTFGKVDPYGFFDGNEAAADETVKFLNLNFVHNPLLDAGGGARFDDYGFTPGLRLAYINETQAPITWGASYGVFATAEGASFTNSLHNLFHIVQLETTQKLFSGLDGHYRFYAWDTQNGTRHDDSDEQPTLEQQWGWGFSVDQRVGDGMILWGRYGYTVQGTPKFDTALTLGAEFSGSYWDRAADRLGLAMGYKAATKAYQAGLANSSHQEQTVELYYNWQATPSLVITPDFQFIHTPDAKQDNADERIAGVRASLSF